MESRISEGIKLLGDDGLLLNEDKRINLSIGFEPSRKHTGFQTK